MLHHFLIYANEIYILSLKFVYSFIWSLKCSMDSVAVRLVEPLQESGSWSVLVRDYLGCPKIKSRYINPLQELALFAIGCLILHSLPRIAKSRADRAVSELERKNSLRYARVPACICVCNLMILFTHRYFGDKGGWTSGGLAWTTFGTGARPRHNR